MKALTLKLGLAAGLLMVAVLTPRGYRLGAIVLAVAIVCSRSEEPAA